MVQLSVTSNEEWFESIHLEVIDFKVGNADGRQTDVLSILTPSLTTPIPSYTNGHSAEVSYFYIRFWFLFALTGELH